MSAYFIANLHCCSSILSVLLSLTTVLSVFATIEVVSGREKFFRVTCTTTGGQALKMNVEGINYSSVDQLQVKVVGERQRVGNDTYSANTSIIAGGNDGDIYQCTASNGVTNHMPPC